MKFYHFFYFLIFCFLLNGCKKEETKLTTKDVYIAGTLRSGLNSIAVIWKNGTPIHLSDGKYNASAEAVYVSGTDVYAIFNENNTAKLWKNGIITELKTNQISNSTSTFAKGLFVLDTNVYIAGYVTNSSNITVATVWKNGKGTSLSNGMNSAYAKSVFVVGNDVYVVGYGLTSNGYINVKLWKNGTETVLSTGILGSPVQSLYVTGSDVYVVWNEYDTNKYFSRLWKNGIILNISESSLESSAESIFVNNNDVYIALTELSFNGYSAKYLKNNYETYLTKDGIHNFSKSIFIDGSDVYVAGFNDSDALYWKNGVLNKLTDTKLRSEANSIFVK